MARLSGKVAVITGGAAGIGLAAARRFVAEGARCLLVDVQAAPLEEAARSLGAAAGSVSSLVADVSREEDAERYVRDAVEKFGRIDVLLANAGVEGVVKPIAEYPTEVFDRVLAVNVRGVWLGLKYAMPAMAKSGGGSIVILSSIAGLRGFAGVSAYVTSKHAVVGLMRTAAAEGAPLGVRVNTVNPSPIETRMMRSLEDGLAPGAGGEAKRALLETIPLGRYGTPEEVADLLLFLSSDESRFVTGSVFSIDGGMSAR